jgi:uroporphyrinogen-III decarboxylase
LNPVSLVRDASPATVRAELERCYLAAGDKYIAGAGCEIPRDTPAANVHAFAEYVRSVPVEAT